MMAIYPKANKSSLAKLVKEKGYDLPAIGKMAFSKVNRSFFLRWWDRAGEYHIAYYTACGGQPMLQVDETWYKLTMAEVLRHDLCEKK